MCALKSHVDYYLSLCKTKSVPRAFPGGQRQRLSASTGGAHSIPDWELGCRVLCSMAKKLRVPMCIRGLRPISEPCGLSYDKLPGARDVHTRLAHSLRSLVTVPLPPVRLMNTRNLCLFNACVDSFIHRDNIIFSFIMRKIRDRL